MRLIILTFLIFITFPATAQTRTYAVKVVGLKVGEIQVTKSQKADSTIYNLVSKVDVNFLVYHLKVDYRVKSAYVNNTFVASEVKVVSNRGNYFTKTQREGDTFKVTSKQIDKEVLREIDSKITSSFAQLFFNEPLKTDKVYAEFYADFIGLETIKPNAYRGELDKNIDEYHFENGLLVKMVKKNPITDMVIEYLPPSNKKAR